MIKLPQIMYGICTFVPGIAKAFRGGAGSTLSARYCYSVWMRHLVLAFQNGLKVHPEIVAEIGPGNSLGVGLAALLSGAEQYRAFDVVSDASPERNLKVFDELVGLFDRRAPIPGGDEFPEVRPLIESRDFPSEILSDARLAAALDEARVRRIADAIRNVGARSEIRYSAPWDESAIEDNAVDMVLSQAVLQHVEDLPKIYNAMRRWLRPNGLQSHEIDFRCHGTTREWNGHWTLSDFAWRLIRGRRAYLLNRAAHSTHLGLLDANGFKVVGQQLHTVDSAIRRKDLAPRFGHLTDSDLKTSSAFIQAIKQMDRQADSAA
jgi:SAM-dependent methyltransferase